MELEAVLLVVRAVAHLATFLILAAYVADDDTHYRLGVSLFAFCLGGASLMAFMMILTLWPTLLAIGMLVQVPWTIIAVCVLVPVALARGNVAKFFKRIPWSYHS